jgi:hypothetical protein
MVALDQDQSAILADVLAAEADDSEADDRRLSVGRSLAFIAAMSLSLWAVIGLVVYEVL